MQITLDEAIRHAMNIAEKQEELAKVCVVEQARDSCLKCANEHRQLAEWIRELQERRKQPEIIYCGECQFREIYGVDGFCDHITGEPIMVKKTDHCSWAERRTDATD